MNRSNRSSSSSMNQSNRSSTSTRTAPLPEDGNKSILSSSTRSSGPRRVSFNHVIKKSFTVVTKEDNSIAGLNSRGIAYYQTGSYTKAAKLFEQAASECSKSLARALWETVQRRCSTKDSVPKSKSMYHNMNLEGYKFYKTVFSVSEQDNVQVMCNITLFNAAQAQRMLGEYERAQNITNSLILSIQSQRALRTIIAYTMLDSFFIAWWGLPTLQLFSNDVLVGGQKHGYCLGRAH
eukprot:CAMPEP_0195281114 /NCGR_PEP_ID=MMETSP0707-20130614/562_1 /TAXON_ID=33640 /ORGANISM="Asterionellopsis glacialis, Strain CCMP134" /LENGTH=235 /DNA_ID=CAMNT_0040339961 /DNA_START=66 /DNA_END=774 /DNA_ORIENTATION=+